jgi:hypothetical protein
MASLPTFCSYSKSVVESDIAQSARLGVTWGICSTSAPFSRFTC